MSDVADAYETDRSTLYRWVKRFQQDGEKRLQRRPTSGRPRTLEDLTENELRDIVLQPASDFGYESDLWTVGRLHAVIEDKYRLCVSNDTIWRRLREAGLTYQNQNVSITNLTRNLDKAGCGRMCRKFAKQSRNTGRFSTFKTKQTCL